VRVSRAPLGDQAADPRRRRADVRRRGRGRAGRQRDRQGAAVRQDAGPHAGLEEGLREPRRRPDDRPRSEAEGVRTGIMALIKMKPTSPGTRFVVKIDKSQLWKGGPHEPLTTKQK